MNLADLYAQLVAKVPEAAVPHLRYEAYTWCYGNVCQNDVPEG